MGDTLCISLVSSWDDGYLCERYGNTFSAKRYLWRICDSGETLKKGFPATLGVVETSCAAFLINA